MSGRSYTFELECPRCKRESVSGSSKVPSRINCGDCLFNDTEIVELTIVRVTVHGDNTIKPERSKP